MKLNEVIPIEKGEKNRAKGAITEIYKKVQKDALFTGIARTYTPKDEEGDRLPPERTDVQLTAQRAVQEFEQAMTRLLDITDLGIGPGRLLRAECLGMRGAQAHRGCAGAKCVDQAGP